MGKQGLYIVLKWVIWLVLLAVGLILALGLVVLLSWPLWTWFLVIAGFAASCLLGYWGYRTWVRRKEKGFVEDLLVSGQGEEVVESDRDVQASLRDKWKDAVDTLQRSHLKEYGNPLYVLPWYMIIGKSGAGKTTAIRNAQLSSPFAQASPTSGPGSTADCDWWFFDQAVILDMAGRYAVGTEEDHTEWQGFLKLLSKYRRHEPINGLILAISVEDLRGQSEPQLKQQALILRNRVDEIMRNLGVRFPVYVLVTKCDLIDGIVPFFEHLPQSRWREVIGFCRPITDTESIDAFVNRAFSSLVDRLRKYRTELAARVVSDQVCPFFLLPEELARLKVPLGVFLSTLFKETPYQDQPLFRGFYLTSGRQTGRPYSHFLKALGMDAAEKELASTERSGFLHDLFAKVLLKDRALLAPTSRALSWQRLSQNLGLSIWVLVGVILCGLLTLSFIRNAGGMRSVEKEMPVELSLGTDIFQNITELDRFGEAIHRLDQRNRGWLAPRLGLQQSLILEKKLQEQFVELYQKHVLWPLQDQLGRQVLTVDATTPRPMTAAWIDLFTRRLYLLNECLDGADIEELKAIKLPDYAFLLKAAFGAKGLKAPPEVNRALARTELTYFAFEREKRPLTKLSQEEKGRLKGLLMTQGIGLLWLPDWANRQVESLQPVTYSLYWGGDPKLENAVGPLVPRAYIPEGWASIHNFINEIASVLDDSASLDIQREAFDRVYRQEYWQVWSNYLSSFPMGYRLWPDRTGQRELAARLAGDESPYRQLFRDLPVKLKPAKGPGVDEPGWARLVDRYSRLENPEYQQLLSTKGKGVLDRVLKGGGKVYGWLQKGLRGEAAVQVFREDQLAFDHLQVYDQSINKFASQVLTRKGALDTASRAFEEGYQDLSEPESPGLKAFWRCKKLEDVLSEEGKSEAQFWGLMQGAPRYLWHFNLAEAGLQLQSVWEQDVLAEIQDPSKKETIEALLSPEGKAHQFVKGPASPFIDRKAKPGYYPKVLLDEKIPFATEFFAFMNQSQADWKVLKGVYRVHIEALPTGTNSGAKFTPHLTRLVLQCGSETQELLNFNQGVSANFRWNPVECQDVLLEIYVGDISLKRRYKGKNAFPRFLNDFQKGAMILRSQDFPAKTRWLESYGISSIIVRYHFQGHEPLIQSLRKTFRRVPEKIIAEDVYSAIKSSKSGDKTKGR